MIEPDLFLDLFYNVKDNSFKLKTNVKDDKIDEILSDCYRTTLGAFPDYREPKLFDVYSILIKLDLSQDTFSISSNTGNKVLAYELIREAINNWEIISEELSFDKKNLETFVLRNIN